MSTLCQDIGAGIEGEKTMRATIVAALLILPTSALADPVRVNALEHSCRSLQRIVEENGAAIIRYPSRNKPGLTLYDRYISNVTSCGNRQMVETMSIPAVDTQRCRVRHCVPSDCDPGEPFCF
jgi:hypothetical protein